LLGVAGQRGQHGPTPFVQREARCRPALDQAPDHHVLRRGMRDAGRPTQGRRAECALAR
jgi:hypothetical protein